MAVLFKGVRVPTTASDLELYSSMKGSATAAREIAAQLQKDIARLQREGKKLSLADGIPALAKLIGTIYREGVEKVQIKHRRFGAADSEPNYHIAQALVDAAKVMLGREDEYMPELSDWL